MQVKKRIFLYTALFYILYLVFPLFADTIHIPVWLPSMVVVAVIIALYPKAFANKTFYWFLVYAAVLMLYTAIGKPLTVGIGSVADSRKIIIELAFILPTISIFCVVLFLKDIDLIKKLLLWFLIFLFASFIVAYPLMLSYNTLRQAYFEQGISYTIPGLPSYSLMHSYVFVVPILCYAFKVVKKQYKWLVGVANILSFLVILRTDVGTCIFLALFVIVAALFYKSNRSAGYWLIMLGVVFILVILYVNNFFADVIKWVLPFVEGTSLENKLIDFQNAMVQDQSSKYLVGRQELHHISWNSFLNNPLIGTPVVGGHSALLDRFGGMGIIGGLPFLMIILSFVSQMKKKYQSDTALTFFWIGILVGFVFLYEKGLWGAECWLFYMVLMPIGILVIEQQGENRVSNS